LALAVVLVATLGVTAAFAAYFTTPTFRVRANNPLIGGVAVKVRVAITCGPFEGLEYYDAQITLRQARGDRMARADGYFSGQDPVCDGTRHSYALWLIPSGDDPVPFVPGEGVVSRYFEICGTTADGYRCDRPSYPPRVITIYAPS
jgi:hypothetical protein